MSASPSTRYSDFSDTLSDDPRNCRVEGCRKKHAYAKFADRKFYSKYCYKHTCNKTGSISEGYHCPNPKRESERYCTEHLTCGESGCRQMGEHVTAEGDEYIKWFCSRHRCTMPRCLERADNRQQQRCLKHLMKCSVSGCDRPCHENRDGELDVVCAAHYGSHKAETKCSWAGCTRRKPGYSGKYCLDHKCELLDCEKPRDPRGIGNFCNNHRCTIDNCSKAVAHPALDSLFCLDHTCKSAVCIDPRQPGTDFCTNHRCRAPNCRYEARFSKGYCLERHGCTYPMCSNQRPVSSTLGVLTDRCEEHERLRTRRSSNTDLPEFEKRERRRNRYSDDIGALRRREKEREDKEREEREKMAREPYDPYRYPNWDRYLDTL